MSDVFVSYVHEDSRVVEYLCKILTANGIKVWRDKEKLEPGVRWKPAIENAIRRGIFFLSIYSHARQSKGISYANEELVVAIEEIRKRPQNRAWFIPIKLDECEIEARAIGGGETILDLQICDLKNWSAGIVSLLKSLGVEDPMVDTRVPLAKGLPPVLEVESGFLRYDFIEGAPEIFQGMEHRISGGWCRRDIGNGIIAYFEIYAPIKKFQDFNRLIGYTGFHAFCTDNEVSTEPIAPSSFLYSRKVIAQKGTAVPSLEGSGMTTLPFDLPFSTSFEAKGAIVDGVFSGKFDALLEVDFFGRRQVQPQNGIFEIKMREPAKLTL